MRLYLRFYTSYLDIHSLEDDTYLLLHIQSDVRLGFGQTFKLVFMQ